MWPKSMLTPLFLATAVLVDAFHRSPCTRSSRLDFQLEECYIPPLSSSILLSSASFLMSHDAATGYIKSTELSKTGLSSPYSKTQSGSVEQQLNDGARALDLRPKLLANGTVVFQHGVIQIPVSFHDLVADAVRWCGNNDNELVLLLPSNFAYESASSSYSIVSAMSDVYQDIGVNYLHCNEVYGLTVGEAMELARLPSGGYLLALDGQDYYGTFCGKSNWIESQLVTCWERSSNTTTGKSCKVSSEPLQHLSQYVLASANNPATDDMTVLGPPENLYDYPFNEIQALWQVDAHAAMVGTAHLSSILDDNRQSRVNEFMVNLIHNEKLEAISLFAVDNVARHGNALLSVLRNSCGQTDLEVCGKELDAPRMTAYWLPSPKRALVALFCIYFVCWLVRSKILNTLLARVQESFNKHIYGPLV